MNRQRKVEGATDNASDTRFKNASLGDACEALESNDEWSGVFRYDVFRDDLVIGRTPPIPLDAQKTGLSEEDVTAIVCWFEKTSVCMKPDVCRRAVRHVAKKDSFHPVKDYLESLPPGDTSILESEATRLFGSIDDIEKKLFRKALIGAVARIYEPGCKMDTVLVLHGEQGLGKSKFTASMFEGHYSDQLGDMKTRDGSISLDGAWGVEVPELDRMAREEISTVKAFVTRTTDKYREVGGKGKITKPRQSVLWATTNESDFLRDITGDRRWWILHVHNQIPAVDKVTRDNLWAAARTLYLNGERWWLTAEEEAEANAAREPYRLVDAWQEKVREAIAKLWKAAETKAETDKKPAPDPNSFYVQTCDVLNKLMMGEKLEQRNRKNEMRVATCLKGLGCTRGRDGRNDRVWKVPKSICEPEKEAGSTEKSNVVRLAERLAKK